MKWQRLHCCVVGARPFSITLTLILDEECGNEVLRIFLTKLENSLKVCEINQKI